MRENSFMKLKLPKSFVSLLHRFKANDNSFHILIYDKSKGMSHVSPIMRGKISFKYEGKKFRPFKFQQVTGNTYRFLRPEDVDEIFRKSSLIIIPPQDKPVNISDFLTYFDKKGIKRPKIMPLCQSCLNENGKLTRFSKGNIYDMYGKEVCHHCASEEIKDEYRRRGIPITSSSRKFYTQLLDKLKKVGDVIGNLWRPIEVSKDPAKTLFDVIPSDPNSSGIGIRSFLKSIGKLNLIDNQLINHFHKIKMNKLLPVQRLAIQEGLLEKRDMLVIAGTSSGKTFIGEIAGLQNWKSHGKKFIFITPLVALSNQKHEYFETDIRIQ